MNQITKPDDRVQLPAHLREVAANEGFLPDDTGLIIPPRLKIIQAMSDESGEQARPGEIWSQAKQGVLAQPVSLVPILEGHEWIAFKDRKLLWRTTDRNDPRATSEFYNFNVLCFVEEELEILNMRRSAMETARAFHTEAKRKRVPLYAQRWELTTRAENGEKGKYYVPVMTFKGFLGAEAFETMRKLYGEFKSTFAQRASEEAKGGEPAHDTDVPF